MTDSELQQLREVLVKNNDISIFKFVYDVEKTSREFLVKLTKNAKPQKQ